MSSFSPLEEVSHSIRQEIIRFESVHPSIYAIYDLVDAIDDKNISDSLRQLVVSIEDAFVNSQEWTLSHRVPDIKLGLLGSIQSGKSALVHRYLTGTYLHEESPEGGRFKKEISLENHSHLLLIRDEGGPPDQQFSHWIDGVIFVFSLENFESYQLVYDYYARLSTYRDLTSLPILLVGTQACLKILQTRSLASGKPCRPITPQFSSTVPSRPHGIISTEPVVVTGTPQPQHALYPQSYVRGTTSTTTTKPPVSVALTSSSVSIPVTASSERNGRSNTNISSTAVVRRSDMHSNAGFEPDTVEPSNDYHPSQTLLAGGSVLACFATAGGTNGTRLFQTLNAKSISDIGPIGSDVTAGRSMSADSPDDWATHPFFVDGQLPHSFIRHPDCLPSEYSESVVQPVTPHTLEYIPPIPKLPNSVLAAGGDLVDLTSSYPVVSETLKTSDEFDSLRQTILATDFLSTTLVAASSVFSVALENEVIEGKPESNEAITPSSTPTHSRKNRRKSNLFQKKNEEEKERDKKINGIGSGRAIPLKQGFLYKRTCKPLSKEWKTKKYVTLTDDARLTYHPSIHDYMENTHGKEIDLSRTTVKIPGIPFRQVGGRITSNGLLRNQLSDANAVVFDSLLFFFDEVHLRHFIIPDKRNPIPVSTGATDNTATLNDSSTSDQDISRYLRLAYFILYCVSFLLSLIESEGYEFQLISMDRQWHFEATGPEERDEWVMYIERAIMTRLQLNESNKRTRAGGACLGSGNSFAGSASNMVCIGSRSTGDNNSLTSGRSGAGDTSEMAATEQLVQSIRSAAGNDFCADCGAPGSSFKGTKDSTSVKKRHRRVKSNPKTNCADGYDPEWASLNLGTMVCISCSGIHRQLGTHISRIRSLHLDEWSQESVAVMCAIGNTLANSVWEAAVPVNAGNRKKPEPTSTREEKEAWIRAKYDHQEFLPPLPYPDAPLQQQLIDAIARQDTRQVVLCLALATPDTVNAPYSRQDPRAAIHIAATLGNLVYLQLLLWYNGDPSVTDHEGRNAFYYAHCSQKYDCAEFLLRSGCPKQLVPPNTTGLSAGSSAPIIRSAHPSPVLPQQQPVLSSHQLGSSLQAQHSVTMDLLGSSALPDPFMQHSSTNPGTGVNQPHHFSHLQQQQQQQSCALLSLPSSLISGVQTQVNNAFLVPQVPPQQPQPFANGGPTSTLSTGMMCGNPTGLAYHGSSNMNLPSNNASYGTSMNQAVGATLPRRRAPPLAPPILQPFARPNMGPLQAQPPISTGTHRPHSGAVLPDRPSGSSVRPAVSSTHHPLPSHLPPVLARPGTSVNSSTSASNSTHPLVQSNQEVGL
ncbi:Arf-GAP with GTPase ANK repeat and PH domain-containing protein 1 [Fasciola hepatica]|uniref:Arf-GAP with GTPase ANK repeat and PH domain-containing protein 1 n=1 Tax=Fasciola hepatica TaxID=6192 RepID=A0A4E0RE58_FASHE|nr:Arf-GAP with GTPase ANK repeat and PH domain-containing protein 1 [Fasciola hepatica]